MPGELCAAVIDETNDRCLAISPTTIALTERSSAVRLRQCERSTWARSSVQRVTRRRTLVVCMLLGRIGAGTNFCGELFGGAPEQSGHVGELFDELGLVLTGA